MSNFNAFLRLLPPSLLLSFVSVLPWHGEEALISVALAGRGLAGLIVTVVVAATSLASCI